MQLMTDEPPRPSRTRRLACVAACAAACVAVAIVASVANGSTSVRDPVARLGEALSIDTDPLVVSALRVVEATSDDAARDLCTVANESDWTLAGRNLNTTTTASTATANATAHVYLCMRQQRVIEAVSANATVLQSLHVTSDANCSAALTQIYSPRSNVAICAQTIDAQTAQATGMYVSDLTVSFEPTYYQTVPGWTTESTSVASNATATDPAFVSYKRPARPISAVRVLHSVNAANASRMCASQLGSQWEQAGRGSVNGTILCVERPLLNVTSTTQGPDTSMLVDVEVVHADSTCSDSVSERQNLTAKVAVCGKFVSSRESVGYLSELRLQNASELAMLPVPTNATQAFHIFQINVDDESTKRVALVSRNHTGIVVTDPAPAPSRSAAASPLVARVSSNASEALTFKILQLADLHMTGDASHECRNPPKEMIDTGKICTEADTTAFVEKVLDAEHPDFVVFSGDNVEVPKDKSLMDALTAALGPVEKRKIPYALVFGNHDDENGQSRADMAERIIGREFSRMQWGPKSVSGVGNYELSVAAPSAGAWGPAGTRVFHMYFLDSHGYPNATLYPGVKSTYDWIKPDQVAYYKELARANRKGSNSSSSGGDGDKTTTSTADVVVPAVMFFHIPIPEYASAGTAPLYRSGEKNEHVASSEVQSNLLSALVEMGDVKATFVGHDHVNEYCFVRQGVQLCYGGGAGFAQAYGSAQFARRTRVVEWSVDAQNRRRIRSWKRHYGSGFDTRQHEEMLFEER